MPYATPTIRLRRLGAELRRLREKAGYTLEEASAEIMRSVSSLSRAELGLVLLRVPDIKYILEMYGVTDPQLRESLFALSRDGRKKGWWRQYADVLTLQGLDYVSVEADASVISNFETIYVPGLLQTEDYARAVGAEGLVLNPGKDLDRFVALRMARQQRLRGAEPPRLEVVVDEAALRRQVGGAEVMRAQLLHLLQFAESDGVRLQVHPYEAGAYPTGEAFVILELPPPGALAIVSVDCLKGRLCIETERDVLRYHAMFDHLRDCALSPKDSAALIERIATDL